MATISDPTRHDPEPGQPSTAWGERAVNVERQVPPAREPSWIERIPAHAFGPRVIEAPPTALHYTIVVVDIVGFGHHSRNNSNQVRTRRGLYLAMRHAFDAAGIPWDRCVREDRGDGALILAPADVPKALFVERLPDALAKALGAHNKHHPSEEQIHLRLALHAGEIIHDEHGVTSSALNHAFRILEAQVFKSTFAESAGVLAVISSDWFYKEVVWQSDLSQVDSYAEVEVTNKETTAPAWIRVVGRLSAGRPQLRWPRRGLGGRRPRRPARGT